MEELNETKTSRVASPSTGTHTHTHMHEASCKTLCEFPLPAFVYALLCRVLLLLVRVVFCLLRPLRVFVHNILVIPIVDPSVLLIATMPLMALSYLALSETRSALTEEVGRAMLLVLRKGAPKKLLESADIREVLQPRP